MKYKVLSKEEIEQMRIEDACDPNQMSEPLPPEVAKALYENTRRKHPHLFPKEKHPEEEGLEVYDGSSDAITATENEVKEFEGNEIYDHANENLIDQYQSFWNPDAPKTGPIAQSDLSYSGQRLFDYKNRDWYKVVNSLYRDEPLPPGTDINELKLNIETLNQGFQNTQIDRNIISYKTVMNIFEKNEIGDIVQWKGLFSTTTDFKYAQEYKDLLIEKGKDVYIMKITVPKGTKGIQVETALRGNTPKNEKEWLMQHNTLIKFSKIDNKKKWIEIKVMDNKVC